MSPIIAEPMREDDLNAVVEVESACYPDPWPDSTFRDELSNTWSTCTVLRDDGRVIGYLVTWLVVDEVTILNIAVHPSHQRRGLAARLVTEALEAATASGARLALLEVRASNAPARGLYERLGFRTAGVRRAYYASNGEDAILMERELPLSPV